MRFRQSRLALRQSLIRLASRRFGYHISASARRAASASAPSAIIR